MKATNEPLNGQCLSLKRLLTSEFTGAAMNAAAVKITASRRADMAPL
jgi:hypothetical protein